MNHPATQARQQLGNTARQEISSTAVEALSRAFREPQLAGYIYWEGKGGGHPSSLHLYTEGKGYREASGHPDAALDLLHPLLEVGVTRPR